MIRGRLLVIEDDRGTREGLHPDIVLVRPLDTEAVHEMCQAVDSRPATA